MIKIRPEYKSVKSTERDDIVKKITGSSTNPKSKSLLSKRPDIDLIQTQTGKKFDIKQIPSVSIRPVTREVNNEKDFKRIIKKPTAASSKNDEVIYID